MNKKLRKTIIIVFWILVWELITILVGNDLLLAGPFDCLKALAKGITTALFWKSIGLSFIRIGLGFIAGVVIGLIFASKSAKNQWFEEVISPVIILVKSIPVASFVVLFLIWWGSEYLASVISFMVVFPNIYTNTLEGIKSTDKSLLEMAKVYNVNKRNKFLFIYRPALRPFWESSLKISVGLSWKSGVAAEVIGTPSFSIGERLYMSKIYIETAEIFAWTFVIILLSLLCEKAILHGFRKFNEYDFSCSGGFNKTFSTKDGRQDAIIIEKLTKIYGDKKVLDNLSETYKYGNTYYLREPSGSGKTTLFRILAGLEQQDTGYISGDISENGVAYMFQEDRLCEEYDPVRNVALVTGNEAEAEAELLKLLDKEDLEKSCSQLSGGMRRRVALVRTFAMNKGIVLLDEPFTGLDNDTRIRVEGYIKDKIRDKCLIIATHI